MHSSRHDQNLASLHAHSSLPGHVLDVVVLTTDAGLLATLREASGPEHAIWRAQSADAAVDLLVGGRCGILIADLGALRGDAPALLDRLQSQFPELVLMATGRRAEEGAVASLVSKGLVYRFLHKPVSPARASLFISAATRRYYELRNTEPIGMATVKTIAAKPHIGKFAVMAVASVALLAAFFGWRSLDKAAPAAVEHSQRAAPTNSEQAADLLARAQIAFASGRLAEPRGDNALDYFQEVLTLQPDDEAAAAGVGRVAAALEARVVKALQDRNASGGAAALMALQRAQPSNPRLDALRADLIVVSRGAAIRESVESPIASVRRSDPFENASSETPDAPRTESLGPIDAFEPGPDARDFPEASASEVVVEPASADILTDSHEEASVLEREPEADAAAPFTPDPGEQQPQPAQAQQDFATNIAQAAALTRVQEVPAEYPQEARRAGLEGWVDVEFTIAPDGGTQDLVVRDAENREAFAQAALDSIRRWRFEPVVRDGEAVAQRAMLRVRFVLQ